MKGKLEFNLPEEQYEFDCAVNGEKAISCLYFIDQKLRNKIKYDIPQKMDQCSSPNEIEMYNQLCDEIEKIREELLEEIIERDIRNLVNG